ncbi:IclR family transcriptional regulator [Cupriavidus oxalaticus]|uniref:IclR family transcriptional regulator n=2 Tax=Cupriavidus oxalaticus TaxID=96344 RepID=A0ABX7HKW6_9BURK|nr:IclR family transcriptional regulator [Cupriavidus oxalaticus]QRQ91002.1 IclR family transcriptional regulator [Cupriavidus oxalaticus]
MDTETPMLQQAGARPRGHQPGIGAIWPRPGRSATAESQVRVAPLARGLAVLAAFGPEQAWLGNQEISLETGIPAPTVTRLLQSLVALGYLHHDEVRRKYRLAAASLALGYAAIADPAVQREGSIEMRKFAEATDTYVVLGTRDRLDVIVLDSRVGSQAVLDLRLTPGTRLHIASSLMGSALLAAIPELERCYLQGNVERKAGRDWPLLRRRMAEKISQVHELGFCMSLGEWEPELAAVAVPVRVPEQPPLVLACIGRTARMARARVERELAPCLLAMAQVLQERLASRE